MYILALDLNEWTYFYALNNDFFNNYDFAFIAILHGSLHLLNHLNIGNKGATLTSSMLSVLYCIEFLELTITGRVPIQR